RQMAWTDVAEPVPGPGEVLVRVHRVGVCAGDLYYYKGNNPYASYPQICGHEIAGEVARLGAGVSGWQLGERVVVEPFIACGRCYPCRIGKGNCCVRLQIIGMHRPGGFAEALAAPAANLHRIPAGLPLELAAFAEPVAIAVQATRRSGLQAGESVVVIGCGPIGLALIEVLQSKGATVTAIDLIASRLEVASRLGAERVIDASEEDPVRAILALTEGEGAGVIFEATGQPRAVEQAAEMVAPGGRIIVLGLMKRGQQVSLAGLDLTRKEMTILGSRASIRCFPEALELLAAGKITYPRAATEFPLPDAPGVFAELDAHPEKVCKAYFRVA
ncbi:MAG TPA: zinc-binding alcohol dehydrogenase family protein, partial [Limnochordia bacterium]